MNFFIEKYQVFVRRVPLSVRKGEYQRDRQTILINSNLTYDEAKITIAHELAHFFYQYELDNKPDRIGARFYNTNINGYDQGAKYSEIAAHMVGHYGAEIQQLTDEIISQLWKDK